MARHGLTGLARVAAADPEAVEGAFGTSVAYAQRVKVYGTSPESATGRYSPAECIGIVKTPIQGEAGEPQCGEATWSVRT